MDVFDTITAVASSATGAALVVGGLVGIIFIIVIAWKSGGAIGAVVTAAVSAGFFIWILNNVADAGVQDQIGNTIVNGAPAPGHAPAGT